MSTAVTANTPALEAATGAEGCAVVECAGINPAECPVPECASPGSAEAGEFTELEVGVEAPIQTGDTANPADTADTADTDTAEAEPPRLTLWSKKSGCVQCDMTHRKLDPTGIPYAEYYLEDHPGKLEEFKNRGLLSAPVVITPDEIWAGFRPDLLDAEIAQWQAEKIDVSGLKDHDTIPASPED